VPKFHVEEQPRADLQRVCVSNGPGAVWLMLVRGRVTVRWREYCRTVPSRLD
jgi:hypothetical protein